MVQSPTGITSTNKPIGFVSQVAGSNTLTVQLFLARMMGLFQFSKGSALDQYGKLFEEAGRRLGLSQRVADNNLQENGLKEAGFTNLTVQTFKVNCFTMPVL